MTSSVTLVKGDDPSLVRDAVQRVVDALVGDGDRGLLVDEHSGDDYEIAALADAAQTPPFLTERRIVVGRELHRFKADELAPLVAYLQDPLPSTSLVLVWESGAVPKALLAALKDAGGEVLDTSPGFRAQDRKAWLSDRIGEAGVHLDRAAVDLLAATVGEDVGRISGILATVRSAFGTERVGAAELEPYLGEAGGVAPWELTDAIDRGDIPTAVERLHRMLGAGDRHALVVLASLHNHLQRMVALDGANVGTEQDAAAVLGLKKGSTFPAKKALEQGRRLGSDKLAQAMQLLARADLDVRGVRDLPDQVVLEVLVARLAHLSRR